MQIQKVKQSHQHLAEVHRLHFTLTHFLLLDDAPIYPVYKYDQNWNPIPDSKNASGYEFDMGAKQTFADGSTRGPQGVCSK